MYAGQKVPEHIETALRAKLYVCYRDTWTLLRLYKAGRCSVQGVGFSDLQAVPVLCLQYTAVSMRRIVDLYCNTSETTPYIDKPYTPHHIAVALNTKP